MNGTNSNASRGNGGWPGAVALAYVLATALSGATQLTPLFPTYTERGILTSFTTTAVFAIYVAGALGMMVAGRTFSQKFGRKPLLAGALVAILCGDIAFYFAGGLPLLLLGRFLSGAGVGIFVAVGSLALIDQLHEAQEETGALLASCANVVGLAAGSVLAGFVAELSAAPLHTPFLVHLALIVTAFAALSLSSRTVETDERKPLQFSFPRIPDEARAVFIPSAIAAFAAFSVGGFFGAFVPAFASGELGMNSALAIGLVASTVFAATVIGNVAALYIPERYAPLGGAGVLLAGTITLGIGLALVSLPLLLVGAVIAGSGNGLVLQAGLSSIKREADEENETEVVTLFFMIAYSALALPILLAGVVQQFFSLKTTAVGFAVGIAALIIVAIVLLLRELRQEQA